MTPRRARWGEPLDDDDEDTTTATRARVCWRCHTRLDTERPVPVCDPCIVAREQRHDHIERAEARSRSRQTKADVRPRDPDALRRRAYADAVARGELQPRPRVRRWWEIKA